MKFRSQLAWGIGGGLALSLLETLTILSRQGVPRPGPFELLLLLTWLALPYGCALWLAALGTALILARFLRAPAPPIFAGAVAAFGLVAWLREVIPLRQLGSTHMLQELLLVAVAAAAGATVVVAVRRLAAKGPRIGARVGSLAALGALLLGTIWVGVASYAFGALVRSAPASAPKRDARGAIATGAAVGHPNIILISIDTLRADHLSCYGYKKHETRTIDALAADGVRFVNTAATAAFTVPSHASMMTGLFPSSHGATYQHDDPTRFVIRGMSYAYPTLAEILKDQGYDTAGFVSCSLTGRQFGFSRGFTTFDDRFDRLQSVPALMLSRSMLFRGLEQGRVFAKTDRDAERRADEVTPLAEAWVRAREADAKPFFLFVHYYDPHAPYAPPEPLNRRADGSTIASVFEGRLLLEGEYTLTASALEDTLALYDGEIQLVDRYLGSLFETLDRAGALENSVIVLTSDHGESFGEHDHWAHTRVLYEDVVHVPFILRLPRKANAGIAVSDVIAQHTDILPTVLSVAGLKVPPGIEGRDLTRFIGSTDARREEVAPYRTREVAFAEQVHDADSARRFGSRYNRDLASARTLKWKYILASTGTEELYDLQQDAGELSNLAAIEPAALLSMRRLLEAWRQSLATHDRTAPTDQIDEGTREILRSLGYVE